MVVVVYDALKSTWTFVIVTCQIEASRMAERRPLSGLGTSGC